MHCTYHEVSFELNDFMVNELPWTQAFWREMPKPEAEADAEFYQTVRDYFSFPMNNKHNLPVYNFNLSSCRDIELTFEAAYAMLVEAVGHLFNESESTIMEYMGCDFLRKHPYFIDYAKWTYRDNSSARQSIYGRFDAVMNPVTEKIEGIYEFNGDTPTMLLESVSLQNEVCVAVTGDSELQLNSYFPLASDLFAEMGEIPGTAAVVFDDESFEVQATSEVVAQIMGEENDCLFISSKDIEFDLTDRENPWKYGDTPLSVIFALVPWEEMVEACPIAYQQWENWARNVTIMEPAWRWFTSNKGIWAYVTYLMENDQNFADKYATVPVLRTYMKPDRFVGKNAYVQKPVIGRMSNNIVIYRANGEHQFSTDGIYGGSDVVYQEYKAPYKVDGRNSFIVGMFMCPDRATDYRSLREASAATLCIREFDEPVLGTSNERFIPHVLIDDVDHDDDDMGDFE